MNVPLTPELEKLIESELESGNFHDSGEFVQTAVLHYLIARDLGEAYTREEIEERIARGLAEIEKGETIDGASAFRQLRELSAERRRQRA